MSVSALIFDTHRMVTDDGPGLRTTLFLKGCPLKCVWCHNPESISPAPQVWWQKHRCIGCGACVTACPEQALRIDPEEGIQIQRHRCTGCGTCARVCPSKAMELLGRPWTVEEATAFVLRDRAFYETGGGGVTLSGGEPTLQHRFVRDLFRNLRESGIHTALDTCGLARWSVYEELLPLTDLFLWDIKVMDPNLHRKLTESPNKLILENLVRLAGALRAGASSSLWIRTPLIPGMTDSPENLRRIARFISEQLQGSVGRWELCAFNGSCSPKYRRLGQNWPLADTEPLHREQIETLRDALSETAPHLLPIIRFTGLIRK